MRKKNEKEKWERKMRKKNEKIKWEKENEKKKMRKRKWEKEKWEKEKKRKVFWRLKSKCLLGKVIWEQEESRLGRCKNWYCIVCRNKWQQIGICFQIQYQCVFQNI